MFQKKQEAAGHNSGPPKQTYYCGSGLLMDYPFEKCLSAVLLLGFVRHHIFWEIVRFCEFQMKETKKAKKSFSKGTG